MVVLNTYIENIGQLDRGHFNIGYTIGPWSSALTGASNYYVHYLLLVSLIYYSLTYYCQLQMFYDFVSRTSVHFYFQMLSFI